MGMGKHGLLCQLLLYAVLISSPSFLIHTKIRRNIGRSEYQVLTPRFADHVCVQPDLIGYHQNAPT